MIFTIMLNVSYLLGFYDILDVIAVLCQFLLLSLSQRLTALTEGDQNIESAAVKLMKQPLKNRNQLKNRITVSGTVH